MSGAAQEGRLQISHDNGVTDILTPDISHITLLWNQSGGLMCKENNNPGFTVTNVVAGNNNVTCGEQIG